VCLADSVRPLAGFNIRLDFSESATDLRAKDARWRRTMDGKFNIVIARLGQARNSGRFPVRLNRSAPPSVSLPRESGDPVLTILAMSVGGAPTPSGRFLHSVLLGDLPMRINPAAGDTFRRQHRYVRTPP
jgi:hypothetical protein